jgi:dienelactone hydrolase
MGHRFARSLLASFAVLTATATTASAAVPAAPQLPAPVRDLATSVVGERTAAAGLPTDAVVDCFAPAGDPEPGTPEWQQRDTLNQVCATLRLRDQLQSPAFGWGNLTEGARLWLERTADQAGDASNPRGGLTTLVPGSQAADPFRTIKRWSEAGRGRVEPVTFESLNGTTLRGHVFAPPASVREPRGGFPGVVITDGSVQAYEELYFWAAQDLAEAGYVVMTYDVQGQGDSDLAGDDCPGECSGVPYQQEYNFHQGAEDSLSFFLGRGNPFDDMVDRSRVGIAGHSLGASAVSVVGQCDTRVKTIVAWDNLRAIENCDSVEIPAKYRSKKLLRVPAIGITNDYMFNVQPAASPPDPHAKDAGYQQLRKAGIDSQIVAIRGGTHLEYTYIPLVLPASQKGERIASYYTRAWFDRYLKGDRRATDRLTATAFDDSIDRTSIGTGSYDVAAATADPGNRWAGNVPHTIAGVPVKDAVSFYYLSQYALRAPDGSRRTCADMRAGC